MALTSRTEMDFDPQEPTAEWQRWKVLWVRNHRAWCEAIVWSGIASARAQGLAQEGNRLHECEPRKFAFDFTREVANETLCLFEAA